MRIYYTFVWLVLGRPVRYGEKMLIPASRRQQSKTIKGDRRARQKMTPNLRAQKNKGKS